MPSLMSIVFVCTQTYSEIFKSALVHLLKKVIAYTLRVASN